MITKRERKKIKSILGNHYSSIVLEELNNKAVRNKYGMPHSDIMVRQVMNGNRSHKEIEAAIFSAVEKKISEDSEEKSRREELLEQTKTGAVTPV